MNKPLSVIYVNLSIIIYRIIEFNNYFVIINK